MYFSYERLRSWSGKVHPVKHDEPWSMETPMRADWTPIVFTIKLPPEEENWTIKQLVAKYPQPAEKK